MQPTAYLERTVILFTLVGVIGASGCLPGKGNLGEYTGGQDESSGTDTATSTTADTTATTDDVPVNPACAVLGEPTDERLESFTFNPQLPGGGEDGFAASCELVEAEFGQNTADLGLQCGEQHVQIALALDHTLEPLLAPGDQLDLDYRAVVSFSTHEWFTLRRPAPDATLVLAGVLGESLEPPGATDFFAPLSLTFQEGVCPEPTNCDDHSESLAIEFTHEGETVQVYDKHSDQIGELAPYQVSATYASKIHPVLSDGPGMFCEVTDASPYYFGSLIRLVPGD